MDFYQMQQILAVAKTRSISEAAKQLYISQPTLSHAIAKAEQEFGTKFFDRSSYPLTLTYAGEKYVETAYKMLSLHRDLEKQCQDISNGTSGKLSIGIPHNRSAQLLPIIGKEFAALFPDIELSFHSGPLENMKKKLYHGELDFLVYAGVKTDSQFRYENLFAEELLVISAKELISPDCLFDKSKNIRPEVLTNLPLLLPDELSGLGKMLRFYMEYHNISPVKATRFVSNNVLFAMANAGLGVAILPQNIIEQSVHAPNLGIYSLSQNGTGWIIYAIFRKEAVISHAEYEFIRIIRQKFNHAPTNFDIFTFNEIHKTGC